MHSQLLENWYSHDVIVPGVVRIWERHLLPGHRSNTWLILGKNWNLLIDPGRDIGDLPAYIGPWLRCPLTAVATNCHSETAGGLNRFPDSAIHLYDADELSTAPKRRLRDGHIFDLGNRQLEVIHVAGPSAGAIVLYEAERKELFTGGFLYAPPEQRQDGLQRIAGLKVDTVYPGKRNHFGRQRLRSIISAGIAETA
jgi:glyoxylase-like metal-dependent hydrolase (beta-lactamase superfamily II)